MISVEKYLLTVDKPAQYLGNEFNSVHKDDYKIDMISMRVVYFGILGYAIAGVEIVRALAYFTIFSVILLPNSIGSSAFCL